MQEDKPEREYRSIVRDKPPRKMTEKQKAARLANLERGRKKRLESLKQKKEARARGGHEEYDLSSVCSDSSETESESENDAFIISKKKKPKRQKKTSRAKPQDDNLRNDVDELKNMVITLANLQ